MVTWTSTDMFVLDVVADDIESLGDIVRRLNSSIPSAWRHRAGRPLAREEVVLSLSRLVKHNLLQTYVEDDREPALRALTSCSLPSEAYETAWFGITPQGRIVHGSWEPDNRSSNQG